MSYFALMSVVLQESTHVVHQEEVVLTDKLMMGTSDSQPEYEAHNIARTIISDRGRATPVQPQTLQRVSLLQRHNGKDKAGKDVEVPWIKDRAGSLDYETKAEAENRLKALKAEGKWREYRIQDFKLKDKIYWRVEMRGSKKAESSKSESSTPNKDAPKTSKKVCLTFDDGPQQGTEDILNVLKSEKAVAAFFLTGTNMASNPAQQKQLVERMLQEGHQLGNHTFTHDPATINGYEKTYGDLSDPAKLKKFQENYQKNERHFRALLGTTNPIFKLARLPGDGRFVEVSGKLISVIATENIGMAHVTWHFEFGTNGSFGHLKVPDWQGIQGVATEFYGLPSSNNIILLHERHWSGKTALFQAILKKLKANNFIFGKLDKSGKCN